ncbi:MAG: RNA 2',3'-cyclic phosphodiesterase [Caldilineaceae bacterium]
MNRLTHQPLDFPMRTFIAIELPTVLHPLLRYHQQQLEALLAAADQAHTISWTPPEKVHLTLRFLGETNAQQRQLLQSALAQVTNHQAPFGLSIGKLGCFPNVHAPSIVWLAVQTEGETLLHLQTQVEQAVQRAGFAPERKPFRPHLTIGRMRRSLLRPQVKQIGRTLAQALSAVATPDLQDHSFVVKSMVHMESQLQPTGAVYTPLHYFNFH